MLPAGIVFFFNSAHWANAMPIPPFPGISRANQQKHRHRFTAVLDRNMFSYSHPEQGGAWMKVLVVDDHVLIREALRSVLVEVSPNVSVLEASDYSQAIEFVDENPDLELITLDLALPGRDGFSILSELRERNPAAAVIVLSASQDPNNVARALEIGAAGYIPKTTKREVMLSAFQLVLAGGRYIPGEILERAYADPRPAETGPLTPSVMTQLRNDLGLTERQVEVLALMMQGKSNKAIGRLLTLAEPTVKNHVSAIFKALEVNSRTEAVIKVGKMERTASSGTESLRR